MLSLAPKCVLIAGLLETSQQKVSKTGGFGSNVAQKRLKSDLEAAPRKWRKVSLGESGSYPRRCSRAAVLVSGLGILPSRNAVNHDPPSILAG